MARKVKEEEILVLNEGDAIRSAMKERGMKQIELAEKLGMLQSGLSNSINRKHISVDVFKTILDAMDYDVAVVDRQTGEVKCRVIVK